MRKLALSLLVPFAFAACQGGTAEYAAPEELVEATADAGYPCEEEPRPAEPDRRVAFEAALVCSLENDVFAQFLTFGSTEDRDRWLDTAAVGGAEKIAGDDWVVTVTDDAIATDLADTIGGDLVE